jgi:hypothetical protein
MAGSSPAMTDKAIPIFHTLESGNDAEGREADSAFKSYALGALFPAL